MSDELKELYQEMIIDHNNHPCNFRKMDDHNTVAEGYNPMCGDHITVYMKIDDGIISDISFDGVGCAISKASASIMTDELKGRKIDEALRIFENVHNMLLKDGSGSISNEDLGKISILSGVCNFPMRVKCATLAWHAMKNAIQSIEVEAAC